MLWMLIAVPLLLLTVTYSLVTVQTVTASDIDLQQAVELAAKAAAMQVTEESQAEGSPVINNTSAHTIFRDIMAENIDLNLDMTPMPGSMAGSVLDYVLVVYNGNNTFAPQAPAGYHYSLINGSFNEQSIAGSEFPATFSVDKGSIVPGAGGRIEVTLDAPGVIAVANFSTKEIIGNTSVEPVRWAAAKVVCQ